MTCAPSDDERGSASVVSAAILLAVVVLAMGAADVGRVLHAKARAQTAADAAALAAAQSLAFPSDVEPAASAADLATRNGAILVGCACEEGTYEAGVDVRMAVGGLFLAPDDLSVAARAHAVVELPAP